MLIKRYTQIALLFLLLLTNSSAMAQVLPKEGSRLNYRLVGFSFPAIHGVQNYEIEIAKGYYKSQDSFSKNIVATYKKSTVKKIVEIPTFGDQYTWRVAYKEGAKIKESDFYHFSTIYNERVDTAKNRLRILQPALQYKDDYVLIDNRATLYDMKGNPLWFLPDTSKVDGYVSDIQFTKHGTVTFIFKNAFETDGNATIIWKAPNNGAVSGDTIWGEHFHHQLTHLSNGHYMVLGIQHLMTKIIRTKDSSYVSVLGIGIKAQDGYRPGRYGTIIEYDSSGNTVWAWESSKHLPGTDFNEYLALIDSGRRIDPHDNSFFFDEKKKVIYVSLKNMNRIIKLEYPSGKILASYGDNFKPGGRAVGAGFFCHQHNIGMTKEGNLYCFNNNSCKNVDSLPIAIVFKEPQKKGDKLEILWQYTCTVEGSYRKNFLSGGNIKELTNGSFFINMGSEYSKLFIIDRSKKNLWSGIPERLRMPDKDWVPNHQYKAQLIDRETVEKVIWKAEEGINNKL